jgi:hypothetical protein
MLAIIAMQARASTRNRGHPQESLLPHHIIDPPSVRASRFLAEMPYRSGRLDDDPAGQWCASVLTLGVEVLWKVGVGADLEKLVRRAVPDSPCHERHAGHDQEQDAAE